MPVHNPLNNGLPRVVLHPGEYRATAVPTVLSDGDPLASDAGRYGIHAMELLINAMIAQGARRPHLQAKAFGGANVFGRPCDRGGEDFCIGEVNIRFVKKFLANEGIPVLARDFGGRLGRQIHFSAPDYSVYLRRIRSSLGEVVSEEQRYLERTREQHKRQESVASVDYW